MVSELSTGFQMVLNTIWKPVGGSNGLRIVNWFSKWFCNFQMVSNGFENQLEAQMVSELLTGLPNGSKWFCNFQMVSNGFEYHLETS